VQPYFQVGIPGVPYSAIRAPLGSSEDSMREWADWVATCAEIIADAYAERFPSQPQDRPSPAQRGTSPEAVSRPPQTNGRAPVTPVVKGSGAFCPKHPNVEAIPSKQLYAKYEEDEFGNQVQANYFCPGKENGTGQNHNLWRRELVWREVQPA